MGYLFRLWFGLRTPVSQKAYLVSGVVLMGFKYACDALLVYGVTGHFFSPLDYINPVLFARSRAIFGADSVVEHAQLIENSGLQVGESLMAAMLFFALPFLWIGLSMSIRRAIDAGLHPVIAMLFFIPGVNYLMMMGLAFKGSAQKSTWPAQEPDVVVDARLRSGLLGVALGLGIAGVMTVLSIFVLKHYGASLFIGTPLFMGAAGAFVHNHKHPRSVGDTILVALLSVSVTGACFLLFALEGVICLAMAFPIALVLAVVGALVGRMIALAASGTTSPASQAAGLLLLPLVCGAEVALASTLGPPELSVTTTRDIDAPPEVVWNNVVTFSELPPPHEWFFDAGISYPLRARIEGEGVGAVRHCEFSTGPFVEPITHWEAPKRLSFDVASQPTPMTELSPYSFVNAPHLENETIRSRRGEFRLTPLDGGKRTHLEGTTWYTLAIGPQEYWKLWSDVLLHAIHGRVLDHIADLSVRDAAR